MVGVLVIFTAGPASAQTVGYGDIFTDSHVAWNVAESSSKNVSNGYGICQMSATLHWSYRGLMPTLDSPELTVSLTGHTVHVTGLLPIGYVGQLPFHAKTTPAGPRTRVHVAYPIATVNLAGYLPHSRTPTRNPPVARVRSGTALCSRTPDSARRSHMDTVPSGPGRPERLGPKRTLCRAVSVCRPS